MTPSSHGKSNRMLRRKILEISSYPPPRAGWGVRVEFVKKALIENGHECQVINIAPESRMVPSAEYLTALGGFDYFRKCLQHSLKGYRIHMHLNGNSPKGFMLTMLAEIANLITFKRPVLTMHAGPYQIYFPKERARHLVPMFKFIFGTARKIICNSEAVKEKIAAYGINPDKVVPIQAFSKQYLQHEKVSFDGDLLAFLQKSRPLISSYVFFRPEFYIESMMQGMAELSRKYPAAGLIVLGSDDNSEDIKVLVKKLGIAGQVFFAGDLDHDTFLTLVGRSQIFLRTPIRDGIASSVLEALSLEVPVVASENQRRPPGSVTYNHEDVQDMVRALDETLQNLEAARRQIVKPQIRDTVADECAILTEA